MDKKTEALAQSILEEVRKINRALHALLAGPRKQDEKSVTAQCYAENKDNRTERDVFVASKANPTPCKANETHDRWYNPFYWWRAARHYWTGKQIIEVIGIFFAIAYAVVTFFQWQEMRTQTKEANRAWMAPGAPTFRDDPINGQPVTAWFPYENVGRQPAIDMKMSIFFDVVEMPKSGHISDLPGVGEDFCSWYPPAQGSGVVFPSKGDSVTYSDTVEQKIVWDSSLEATKTILRVRGCISYLTFKELHHSWFCMVFSAFQNTVVSGVTTVTRRRVGSNCPDGNGAN